MSERDVAAEVLEIIAHELGRHPDEINQETDLSDLDDDGIMGIIFALEEQYGTIPDNTIEGLLRPCMTEIEFEPEQRVIKVSDLIAIVREQDRKQHPQVLSSQAS